MVSHCFSYRGDGPSEGEWVSGAEDSTAKGEWKARIWVFAARERESERECLEMD